MTYLSQLPANYDRDMTTPPPGYFGDDDGYAIPDEDIDPPEEEEPESTALIAITQLPEIKENLRALRDRWEAKAEEAAALVCTADSVQTVKQMRADMRKEFDEADTQRKAVKERYMAAWTEVEATWKECVATPFKQADAAYKATIDGFEGELKAGCRERLQTYFDELCSVHGIDFLTLDQAMAIGKVKISLADANAKTPKKLMDDISAVVARVGVGMDQINAMPEEDRAAIRVEYKHRFDVGDAVATVQARKLREESEREAAEARKAAQERRKTMEARVIAAEPPKPTQAAETPNKGEEVFEEFSFTVYGCTRKQLIGIRNYLKQEGIRYE